MTSRRFLRTARSSTPAYRQDLENMLPLPDKTHCELFCYRAGTTFLPDDGFSIACACSASL